MSKEWMAAFKFAHEENIKRYERLLRTHLTDNERTFVERRLAEEQSALEQLGETPAPIRPPVHAA